MSYAILTKAQCPACTHQDSVSPCKTKRDQHEGERWKVVAGIVLVCGCCGVPWQVTKGGKT